MSSRFTTRRRTGTRLRLGGFGERIFLSAGDRALANAVENGLERVEAGLLDHLHFADGVADAAARYLAEAGGKRVRPMLTLLIAQLGDGATDDVVAAAQAIEITHLGSLYHDDVMDDADKRRGVPSAHTVWGNSVAILTGDLLFARASHLMSRLGESGIALQTDTFERLVLGQLHETVGPEADEDHTAHYLRVLADKTGSLLGAAARAGVTFSNAPKEYENAVALFGERVGVAFQLADDVLDLAGDSHDTGKLPGTDVRAGVTTLPVLRLRERALSDPSSARLLERIEEFAVGAHGDDPIVAEIVAELRDHEATAYTLAEARRWADEAVAALEPIRDKAVTSALTRFAESIVDREA